MDEPKKEEEKLLFNPLDTPEILSAQLEKPLHGTEQSIKTTPRHELKNIFGATPDKTPEPKIVPPISTSSAAIEPAIKVQPAAKTTKNFDLATPTQHEKETATSRVATKNPETVKPKRSIGTFLFGVFFVLLILLIGLYIWGGIIKERGVSPVFQTLPQ